MDGIRKAVHKIQSQADTTSSPSEKKLQAEIAFQYGNILMMFRQFDIAIEAYSYTISMNPNNTDAYYNRGVAYCHRSDNFVSIIEDFKKAIENFDKVTELNPNYLKAYRAASQTHYELGTCYCAEGDDDLAIEHFTIAIQLQPDYFEGYQSRANAYLDKGEYDLAIEDYTKTIEISPNDTIGYYIHGITYQRQDQINRAIEDYNKAILLKPDLPMAHYNRGTVFLHLQEWELAKTDLTNAKDMQESIIENFAEDYGNIAGFDRQTVVRLPADIVALLTPPQA